MRDNATSAAELFQHGQIRLSELTVYNWGSFDGLHSASIDPYGTLITGDNGAGKSTFVDGLMALLLPAGKATFNVAAAQGDRADRTLLSYMRGSFGAAHEGAGTRVKSKREKAVVTGLRALYRADDGAEITLAALFWTTQASNALSDVSRVYVVAKRNLALKDMLDAFGEGNARQLKQWLRDDPRITCCDEHFAEYQELYRKLLHMDNRNAPALLSRALGLKKIDDLTRLIRELVLEPSAVREDAREVVDEFADLVAIHDRLSDARAQVEHLQRLPELAASIQRAEQALQQLWLEKHDLRSYFAEAQAQLWVKRIAVVEAELAGVTRQLEAAQRALDDAAQQAEGRHEAYLQHGGNQVEALRKELAHAEARLKDIARKASQYQQDMRALGLPEALQQSRFVENQRQADSALQAIDQSREDSQNRFAEASGQLSQAQQQLRETVEQIREIEARPNSNIEPAYQRLRDELVAALELDAEQLVFIGELLDVKDEETAWQGAIERALGGLRTTLLVPAQGYSMVTRWLNARHTGLHVRVQVVRSAGLTAPPSFWDDGFLRKLVWRQHPYRDWLKQHLSRHDLHCVDSTETLDATPFSTTREGLVQREHGRFEKKDQARVDDRRRWCLGFSNATRLALLNGERTHLQSSVGTLERELATARTAMDEVAGRQRVLERVLAYHWDELDAPYWEGRQSTLKSELQALESADGDLAKALARWQQAKDEHANCGRRLGELQQAKGKVQGQLESAQKAHAQAAELAAQGVSDEGRALLAQRVGAVTLEDGERQAAVDRELDRLIETERGRKGTAENIANGIMGGFRLKDQWSPLVADWPTGLAGLGDFLAHLQALQREGLPALVEQFRERLNRHATQSLARIRNKLDAEREQILERLQTINAVLRRSEFKVGSHLRLGSRREQYPHVQDFQRKLNRALSQINSDEHELRFQSLSEVVAILDKASSTGTAGTLESLRLLDPRYQMTFYAEEVDSVTEDVRDVLNSSSGKSGGEKESFAGMVVAASLAYVLTPDGHDKPVYCTVFLDEAFSNTAESVSRRVLRVFRELHIHVNLITPYKNLNLARESARSLLIAERDADSHESHLCELTWEEIDQRMAQAREAHLQDQAAELGVQVDG
ncbi:MAG: ATP-binding protein [Pseudomonas sp.]|uniref:ATP-binding protein n=1 Tax=Pseudomonas sp. TaxID=306 RepID=UPI0032426A1C